MSMVLQYGVNRFNGRIVHVRDVANGEKCGCLCPACNEALIARQGEKNEWHFAHPGDTHCTNALESALHRLAKQLIVEAKAIRLPDGKWFTYNIAQLEFSQTGFRADVCVSNATNTLFIEIVVTSPVTSLKQSILTSSNYPTLVIDLSDVDRSIEVGALRPLVIEKTHLKHLFPTTGKTNRSVSALSGLVFVFILVMIGWRLLSRSHKKFTGYR